MHFIKAKGILSAKNNMNLYHGCSHGCIYCDSRSKCYHMEHDFEDIEVKENALKRKRSKCMLGTGSMTVNIKVLASSIISKIVLKYPSKARICFTRINLFLIFNFHIFRNLITPRHKIL